MKRLLIVILTVCCACALAVGSAAFAADSSGSYAAAFDKVSSDSNTSGMEISQNGEDITDGVLIPAGSVKLACDDASNGVTNLFLTKSKAVNMEKPVYIKWRENFTGDIHRPRHGQQDGERSYICGIFVLSDVGQRGERLRYDEIVLLQRREGCRRLGSRNGQPNACARGLALLPAEDRL